MMAVRCFRSSELQCMRKHCFNEPFVSNVENFDRCTSSCGRPLETANRVFHSEVRDFDLSVRSYVSFGNVRIAIDTDITKDFLLSPV